MPYDPQKHHRRSIRLQGYDYAQAGAYFVTICTQHRALFFQNQAIQNIAAQCWQEIPDHFPLVELDVSIVMPNHIHGIIVIVKPFDADRPDSRRTGVDPQRMGIDPHRTGVDPPRTGVDPPRTGVQLNAPTAPLDEPQRAGIDPPRTGVDPPRTGVDPHRTGVDPPRTGVQLNAPTAPLDEPRRAGVDSQRTGVDPRRMGVRWNAPIAHGNGQHHDHSIHDAPSRRDPTNPFSIMSPYRNTLAVVVRTYKAAVTTLCRRAGYSYFAWQRSYYEHVIRSEEELDQVRHYILNNPAK